MINGCNAYNGFVSYSYGIMNQLILPDELDFSTLSTEGLKMLRLRGKLYVCKKKTRDIAGNVFKCYWYCSTKTCHGSLSYLIDVANAQANADGTGIALNYVAIIRWHF